MAKMVSNAVIMSVVMVEVLWAESVPMGVTMPVAMITADSLTIPMMLIMMIPLVLDRVWKTVLMLIAVMQFFQSLD